MILRLLEFEYALYLSYCRIFLQPFSFMSHPTKSHVTSRAFAACSKSAVEWYVCVAIFLQKWHMD